MSEVLLQGEKLTRRLKGDVPVTLVREADVTIHPGEFVVIIGPSGSGKSSLLYLLGLLDRPDEGRLLLQGEDTAKATDARRAAIRLEKLGFVFQSYFLLPEFSALENVMLPMQRLGRLSERKITERAGEILHHLGLGDQLHKLPRQLSGGQSQRVAIARALANDPLLILADEPTGNLDSASSANVQSILKTLAHEHNRAVVTVTHDTAFAETADRVITIVDGKIQE